MRANGEVLNPGKVEVKMTFTMPLEEWESIAEQMGTKYPAWKFTSAISDVSSAIRKSIHVTESEK